MYHNFMSTSNCLPLLVSALLVEGWRSDLKSQNQSIICCIQIAFTSLHNNNHTASFIHNIMNICISAIVFTHKNQLTCQLLNLQINMTCLFLSPLFFYDLRKAGKQELFTLLLTKRSKRKNLL